MNKDSQVKHTSSKSLEGEVVVKNVGGRPSKLTNDMVDRAYAWVNERANMSAARLLPTVEGLALELGITRETFYKWSEEDARFSDIARTLKQSQAEKLIQNALLGNYNPAISKLLLSKHGYVEKQEIDNKVSVVQPIVGGMAKAELPEDTDGDTGN